jgi:hypothetical protein
MFNNHYKCIPMFRKEERQHFNYEDVVNRTIEMFPCFQNLLHPFQVRRRRNPSTTYTFHLLGLDGVMAYDLSLLIDPTQIIVTTAGNFDLIQYLCTKEIDDIDCGQYYYYFADGSNEWYSEIFTVKTIDAYRFNTLAIIDGLYIDIASPGETIDRPVSPAAAQTVTNLYR